jgi:uncharacterized phiE125 gp8 family phage protein
MSARAYAIRALEARRALGASTLLDGPNLEPVSVATLKKHSRLNDTGLDLDLLPLRITAARQWVEGYTGRALLQQTWLYAVDYLEDSLAPLLLPRAPLLDVLQVSSYDPEGIETTVPATAYRVDTGTEPGRLFLDPDIGYWAVNPRTYGGLAIEYRAGYGTLETDVPEIIREAILLLAAELCERLEGASDLTILEVPLGIKFLVDPFRLYG